MNRSIPQFGPCRPENHYVLRPGGYAVVVRADGALALVANRLGVFLPGGGQHPGETPAAAALRETAEECGMAVRLTRELGLADELLFAADEQTWYRKRGAFFLAEVVACRGPGEADHRLLWLPPAAALECLHHGSHRWAVAHALPSTSG